MHLLALLLQNQPDPAVAQKMALAFLAFIPIVIVVGLAIVMVPFWFILKKAGFSPWLTLLFIVPLGNLILYYMLAFGEWKVMPVPQAGWGPPPPYPPQPPYTPPQQYPPQA
jgi:hypothetical protein